MNSTRETLERVSQHVEESMGVRDVPFRPRLSPVPSAKDIGRRPLRGYGRLEIRQLEPDPEQPRTEFDEAGLEELAANIKAFVDAIVKAKPAGAKGTYIKKISVSSTMGPGVKVNSSDATAKA